MFSAVKIAPVDADIMDLIDLPAGSKALIPSEKTTLMRNEYFTADRERRNSSCAAQSGPVLPDEVPGIDFKLCHLAGLLYGDFPGELIEFLAGKGKVAADAQGFLRCNENGRLVFRDWPDKLKYLPYLAFLKTDAAEAEILTGLSDREAAARQLYAWGAKEVMVSHNTEMLVFDGEKTCTCPVKARNLSTPRPAYPLRWRHRACSGAAERTLKLTSASSIDRSHRWEGTDHETGKILRGSNL